MPSASQALIHDVYQVFMLSGRCTFPSRWQRAEEGLSQGYWRAGAVGTTGDFSGTITMELCEPKRLVVSKSDTSLSNYDQQWSDWDLSIYH